MNPTILAFVIVAGIGLFILNTKDLRRYSYHNPQHDQTTTTTTTISMSAAKLNINISTIEEDERCWYYLDPPWGVGNTSSYPPSKHVCAIRKQFPNNQQFLYPYSHASTLKSTCDDDDSNKTKTFNGSNRGNEIFTLTVVLLYYCNPVKLVKQIQHFQSMPTKLISQIQILIVDDGSPPGLQANEYYRSNENENLHIRIIRVIPNVAWNMPQTQNIGFYLASKSQSERVIMLDLDTFVNFDVLQLAMSIPLISTATATTTVTNDSSSSEQQRIAYQFMIGPTPQSSQQNEPRQQHQHTHPKIALLSPTLYWNVGGYDEGFVGHYGHDDYAFWYRLQAHPNATRLRDPNLWVSIGDDPDDVCLVENDGDDNTDTTNLHPTNSSLSSSTAMTLYEQCKLALENLPHPPKRSDIPINKKLWQRRHVSGCWSNHFLRYRWVIDL